MLDSPPRAPSQAVLPVLMPACSAGLPLEAVLFNFSFMSAISMLVQATWCHCATGSVDYAPVESNNPSIKLEALGPEPLPGLASGLVKIP